MDIVLNLLNKTKNEYIYLHIYKSNDNNEQKDLNEIMKDFDSSSISSNESEESRESGESKKRKYIKKFSKKEQEYSIMLEKMEKSIIYYSESNQSNEYYGILISKLFSLIEKKKIYKYSRDFSQKYKIDYNKTFPKHIDTSLTTNEKIQDRIIPCYLIPHFFNFIPLKLIKPNDPFSIGYKLTNDMSESISRKDTFGKHESFKSCLQQLQINLKHLSLELKEDVILFKNIWKQSVFLSEMIEKMNNEINKLKAKVDVLEKKEK